MTTIIKAKDLESYFIFKVKQYAKKYPNDFDLGAELRKLTL